MFRRKSGALVQQKLGIKTIACTLNNTERQAKIKVSDIHSSKNAGCQTVWIGILDSFLNNQFDYDNWSKINRPSN